MNPELIEKAVRDYSSKLLKIAYNYTRNKCDAEEIHLFYHKKYSMKEIAKIMGKSLLQLARWLTGGEKL